MKKEQIEEIISYLTNNKNNLPNYIIPSLEKLYQNIDCNISQLKNLSTSYCSDIHFPEETCEDEQDSSSLFEHIYSYEPSILNSVKSIHTKVNYPHNIPPRLSSQEINQKIISFPHQQEMNTNHKLESDLLNSIKDYHEQHKIRQNELLKEHNNSNEQHNYFDWIQISEIEKLNEEIVTAGTPDKIAKLKKYIDKIKHSKPILEFEEFQKFNSLNIDCPNFKEVSQFYKGNIILNNSKYLLDKSYHAPTPILLLGEPGIGKTHFAKKLAKLLGTSFHFLDANSITASWVLTGSSGQWQNADAGNIFKYMLESNTMSPVVILDEIDKLSQGKNYDPFSVFHQMFEPENSRHFKDEFLNVTFDASKIIYILTANTTHNIPESLLSRMKVFDIEKPTLDEMKIIAQNIYQELIGNSPLLNGELSHTVLSQLIYLSPRDIKKEISNAVFSQLANNQELNQELILDIQHTTKNWGF